MSWEITEEKKFLNDLRQSSQPLQVMAAGRFIDKQHPLDYAYGLIIGAGLTRCECGIWGKVEDLQSDDGVPLTCSHCCA